MIKVLITGANGQLGQALQYTQGETTLPMSVTYATKTELDITDLEQLLNYLQHNPIQYLINCAAYTQVDLAETEPIDAYRINEQAPGYLAMLAKQLNFTLLHISTDYVFEGTNPTPLTEDMLTNPINYYGQTKLGGEYNILAQDTSTYIIRTSWLYSTLGNNFLTRLMDRFLRERSISMAYDQISSPTYAPDLAKAIWEIISQLTHKPNACPPGIYHYANEGLASRYDFAWQISNKLFKHADIRIEPSTTFQGTAKRPAYTVFNKQKIKQTFGLTIPYWQESLDDCLKNLMTNNL